MSYNYQTENPFASTNSLDANPFDDPETQSSKPTTTPNGISLEELQRRERDLERREQELNKKADHIRVNGRNNWPPFFPLLFHSIQEEIPEASRALINNLYRLWMELVVALIINMIACIFIVSSGESASNLSSIGLLIVIPPLSFLLWYRPIYNGYMKEQALYYYLYFFFGGWHLLFILYMLVGIPTTGSAGIIVTIGRFIGGHLAAGILGVIACVGWGFQAVAFAWFFRLIWQHRKAAGHTFEKAKSELTTHGAKAYFSRN